MFRLLAGFGLLVIGALVVGPAHGSINEQADAAGPLWATSLEDACGADEPLATHDWQGAEEHEERTAANRACQRA